MFILEKRLVFYTPGRYYENLLSLIELQKEWLTCSPTASGRNLEVSSEDTAKKPPSKQEDPPPTPTVEMQDSSAAVSELSERRKALFEPLEPIKNINGRRSSAESLLPPPDFDSANYPKGWLIGKKRKLVNVDVVESMRRIAVQEMNRKVNFTFKLRV